MGVGPRLYIWRVAWICVRTFCLALGATVRDKTLETKNSRFEKPRMPPKDAEGKTTQDELCEECRGEHGEGWVEQTWMCTLCGAAVNLLGG